jgi:hypothetical protein
VAGGGIAVVIFAAAAAAGTCMYPSKTAGAGSSGITGLKNKERGEMDEIKIKAIFSDVEFVTSLLELETAEDVQKALATKGIELSLEELNALRNSVVKASENYGELNEADLEKVAGGGWRLFGKPINDSNVKNFLNAMKRW